jgi:hypothetical protein
LKTPQEAEFVVESVRMIGSDIQNVWRHGTRYFCSLSRLLIIPFAIRAVLIAYQRFLLRTIQSNCESAFP